MGQGATVTGRGATLRFNVFSSANLRLLGMLGSLVVIVVGAYLVRSNRETDSEMALRWVAHTHEVRAALYQLTTSLNDMQAAALSAEISGSEDMLGRYQDARRAYPPLVDRLRNLTIDNPEQQERVGMLRARIEERVALFDRALRRTGRDAQPLAAELGRFPVDDITDAILEHEQRLVRVRERAADSNVRLTRWVGLATMLAQILLLGTVILVSERHLRRRAVAEREARRAVDRARLIVETVREPIAVIGSDLKLIQVNHAFAQFYGLTIPVTGALTDIPVWNDAALNQRLRDVSTTRRELWDFETTQQLEGEVRRDVVVNARPMELPEMGHVSALLTISDMTIRKRSEGQVLELNRQLSGKIAQITEVNRELEAFSYSVSHDLRAPLRHISGFADKLRQRVGEAGDPKVLHYCDVIADSARRMSMLIEDLLSYSRLGRHALKLQAVDFQSLVEEVRSTLMSAAGDRAIEWRIAPLPVAIADASLMRLVWQNLLDNAIKYTGGKSQALIEIGIDDTGPDARVFWVRDNGVGFDMAYAGKLFGVFQRLHKASDFPGSGIGLASVRRIIARHGGQTWAESQPGRGAVFSFSLPRHESID